MDLSLPIEPSSRLCVQWLTRGLLLLFAMVVGTLFSSAAAPVEVFFTEPESAEVIVPEGHLMLRWEVRTMEALAGVEFELEQHIESPRVLQRIAYRGSDTGTFVSGLPDSGARYRIRARMVEDAEWGPWSDPLQVRVNYPSRLSVALLGMAGASMFVVLLAAILIGSRRSRVPSTPTT